MVEYSELLENELLSLLELYRQLEPNDEIINEITAKNIWKIVKTIKILRI